MLLTPWHPEGRGKDVVNINRELPSTKCQWLRNTDKFSKTIWNKRPELLSLFPNLRPTSICYSNASSSFCQAPARFTANPFTLRFPTPLLSQGHCTCNDTLTPLPKTSRIQTLVVSTKQNITTTQKKHLPWLHFPLPCGQESEKVVRGTLSCPHLTTRLLYWTYTSHSLVTTGQSQWSLLYLSPSTGNITLPVTHSLPEQPPSSTSEVVASPLG